MGLALDRLTANEIAEFEALLHWRAGELAERSLAHFVRQAWQVLEPATELRWNWHLDVLCAYLEGLWRGLILPRRLVINIPPGTMKSLLVSVFYPAWVWIQRDGDGNAIGANESFLNLTNEGGLATRDTMRMRWLVASDWYQGHWGERVKLATDQREKTHIANSTHGFRMGQGITAAVTGKRVAQLIIDDPHDAKKALGDAEVQSVCESYDQAVSSRLRDPKTGAIVLIMQRLRTNDLSGHLAAKKQGRWTQVVIPMEFEGAPGFDPVRDLGPEYAHLADPRRKVGALLMPHRFDEAFLREQKENLGEYGWAGQMQQRPVPSGGGVIKTKWWKRWPAGRELPTVQHVFCSWDTAYTEEDYRSGSYSAMTAWGVWWHEQQQRHCLMVLGAWWERVGYPSLRRKVKEEETKRQPDAHLIEKKASGQSLIQDLRRGKVRVRGYDPRPDGDKLGRAALASATFEAGLVWAPEAKWADQVIEYVSQIPTGAPPSGDVGDTVTQAVRYLTKGWWVTHPDDDEPTPPESDSKADEDDDELELRREVPIYG
jgi:predicted phage terminase large subunit-like protein